MKTLRCGIYTRKSTEEGLEQEFNSLVAQRDACEAYIKSQMHEGWKLVRKHYDDGGFSGGTLKPAAIGRGANSARWFTLPARASFPRGSLGSLDSVLPPYTFPP